MSALPPKADIAELEEHVALSQKRTSRAGYFGTVGFTDRSS